MKTNNPPPPTCCWNSKIKDDGKAAIIPIMINREIPFPIPRSVIFSPNHMAKIVPVERIIILEIQKTLNETSGCTAPGIDEI